MVRCITTLLLDRVLSSLLYHLECDLSRYEHGSLMIEVVFFRPRMASLIASIYRGWGSGVGFEILQTKKEGGRKKELLSELICSRHI